MSNKQRWWGLLGALALTVLAVQWVDSGEAPPAAPPSGGVAQTESVAGGSTQAAAATDEVRLDRLRREPYPALKTDLFPGDLPFSETEQGTFANGGTSHRAGGPPPPPPIPFAYMGKMLDDGEVVVFLTRGDRNYLARKGATLDGQYRVDEIRDRTMVLTYLPQKVKQSLAIGSAP